MASNFPELYHGKPQWPSKDDDHLFWVGLHSAFRFAHHPSAAESLGSSVAGAYFCPPDELKEKISAILEHSNGGSVLITGYRGTGKTSLVNACLKDLEAKYESPSELKFLVKLKVNLSTVTSANEVLLLAFEALGSWIEAPPDSVENEDVFERIKESFNASKDKLRAERTTITDAGRRIAPGHDSSTRTTPAAGHNTEHSFAREVLSRSQGLLADTISKLTKIKFGTNQPKQPQFVFIFDELDKLLPTAPPEEDRDDGHSPAREKLAILQRIVAELKFFLTESNSHHIFIAGKDVDDSWAEDQNKGEGIFESIFAANIYVPSIFTSLLKPCAGGLPGQVTEAGERLDFYEALSRELGIPKNSWAFNTALLILPHLAEYELLQLLLRAQARQERNGGISGEMTTWVSKARELVQAIPTREPIDWRKDNPMSERTCRRLRIMIEYLTYKGRGIPRKILREFYTMVRDRMAVPLKDPGEPKLGLITAPNCVRYVLALPQHHLQKMNFYAGIVEFLDSSFAELRGLNDKGRVAIYHIIDYILKFYATGFSHRDIEHANFMTSREEFFPTRQLAALIIRLLDGKLWKRKESRSPEFRLLHGVSHDLSVMFLRYGPEQMELRHTINDFREELRRLRRTLRDVGNSTSESRLEPVHAQLRLGKVHEMLGNHFEARLGYYKALRWLRMDVAHFEGSSAAKGRLTRSFTEAFAGYLMESLLSLGRMHEQVGEHKEAASHYLEAEQVHRSYLDWLPLLTTAPGEEFEGLFETLMEPGLATNYARNFAVFWEAYFADPLRQPGEPVRKIGNLVEVYNHQAIAFSKMWERRTANECLVKSLLYLGRCQDAYGMIDQMYLIGQFMVRRRDFRAAALWYLQAAKGIIKLKEHSNPPSPTGPDWHTPPMSASTFAQLAAALGDVYFATGGHAFVPSGSGTSRADIEAAMNDVIEGLGCPFYEDRLEEYFLTGSRLLFQPLGDQISGSDVYLRQLETRLDLFRQAARTLQGQSPSNQEKYTLLNTWASFWKGARVMLHRQILPVSALTRGSKNEWGRIADFRRLGVLLRLCGEMLRELVLTDHTGNARKLLRSQSVYNHNETESRSRVEEFYAYFFQATTSASHLEVEDVKEEILRRADTIGKSKHVDKGLLDRDPDAQKILVLQRVAANRAARDIGMVFAYLTDEEKWLTPQRASDFDSMKPGERSPLYRINNTNYLGDARSAPTELAIQHVYNVCKIPDLRLLGLAESALLSAYLCHRDCIPDFSYAHTCLSTAELYLQALYIVGQKPSVSTQPDLSSSVHGLTNLAKRFLMKAIDVLRREREQNRNTFHLLSEAYFNLGDVLMVRLAALKNSGKCRGLFGNAIDIGDGLSELWLKEKSQGDADTMPEDLQRQIWDAYRNGLILVLSEIEEYEGRYRFPPEVFHAHRNMMDAVLHFRICRAARLRHEGCVHGENEAMPRNLWERLSTLVDAYESPIKEINAWLQALIPMHKAVSDVRTDRSPFKLTQEKSLEPVSIQWCDQDDWNRKRPLILFGK